VPIELSIYLDTGEPGEEPTPPPPGVAFATELNAAAHGETTEANQ